MTSSVFNTMSDFRQMLVTHDLISLTGSDCMHDYVDEINDK